MCVLRSIGLENNKLNMYITIKIKLSSCHTLKAPIPFPFTFLKLNHRLRVNGHNKKNSSFQQESFSFFVHDHKSMALPVRGGRGGGKGMMRSTRGGFQHASGRAAATGNIKKASSVPAFPVVRRASHQGHSHEPAPHVVSSRRAGDDEDDEAAPIPQSARQSGRAGRHPQDPTTPPPAAFHSASTRPLKGHSSPGMAPRRQSSQAPERPSQAHPRTPSAPSPMITTITADGTELPQKLNNKIFIDGLPYQHTAGPGGATLEDELFQFLTAWKVGKPLRLIKKSGQGFGFVVFKSPNSVPTAVKVLNGRKFLRRALRVEVPKARDLETLQDRGGAADDEKDSFRRQVLLTDLAKVAQPEVIREVLRDIAPQLEQRLQTIKMTSRNRKAFLTFESEEDVGTAITFLDRFHLLGRRISAVRAAPPGTLPYSRGGAKPASSIGVDEPQSPPQGGLNNDDDNLIVPLGIDPSAMPRAKAPQHPSPPAPKPAFHAVGASTGDRGGQSRKYDRLVKGSPEIYVGNLGEHLTTQQLREHFEGCGKLLSCEILVHPETHLSRGIGKLIYALPSYAAAAQERLHGSRLRGCVLRVDRGEDRSAPLASELPPVDTAEEYDEDAYIAERFGIKDKERYFKGTSFEANDEGKSVKPKRAKRALEEDIERPPQRKKAEREKKESFHGDADLVVGGDLFANHKKTSGRVESDDEEEQFFDVDDDEEVQERSKAVKGNKGKPKKSSAVTAKKSAPSKARIGKKTVQTNGKTKKEHISKPKTQRK
ncbi:unnamed protein product [Phytomonas sp. Hart1]|nr:unnamed protein product [Phytomonas sp. Hart1]|eukprot:CCW67431.1 unnamed protein product [Phytomonas sp. isolate Hart1]